MDRHRLAALLGQLEFPAGLPADMLEELAGVSTLRGFPAGMVLFREGSLNQEAYLICIGRVALDMNVPTRGKVRILSLGPGDVVAWSAVLGQGRMTTSAVALEDTQVVAIDGPRLVELCEQYPALGYQVMRRMAAALARRLVATRLQLLDLFADTTPETIQPANP